MKRVIYLHPLIWIILLIAIVGISGSKLIGIADLVASIKGMIYGEVPSGAKLTGILSTGACAEYKCNSDYCTAKWYDPSREECSFDSPICQWGQPVFEIGESLPIHYNCPNPGNIYRCVCKWEKPCNIDADCERICEVYPHIYGGMYADCRNGQCFFNPERLEGYDWRCGGLKCEGWCDDIDKKTACCDFKELCGECNFCIDYECTRESCVFESKTYEDGEVIKVDCAGGWLLQCRSGTVVTVGKKMNPDLFDMYCGEETAGCAVQGEPCGPIIPCCEMRDTFGRKLVCEPPLNGVCQFEGVQCLAEGRDCTPGETPCCTGLECLPFGLSSTGYRCQRPGAEEEMNNFLLNLAGALLIGFIVSLLLAVFFPTLRNPAFFLITLAIIAFISYTLFVGLVYKASMVIG
jgi:hypothetical protein